MPMIIDDCIQGSPEWFALRLGIPTASEFDRIITPATLKPRTGEGRETYLCEKIAESITHRPILEFGGSFATEQGVILERQARGWYEFEHDCKIRQVSFVYSDDDKSGCSPDGLIGEDAGIEIKCPRPQTHVGYLRGGQLPREYALQVHGSMYVSGRARWHFLSFCRRFPVFLITVERDEAIIAKIAAAIDAFSADLQAGLAAIQPSKPQSNNNPKNHTHEHFIVSPKSLLADS